MTPKINEFRIIVPLLQNWLFKLCIKVWQLKSARVKDLTFQNSRRTCMLNFLVEKPQISNKQDCGVTSTLAEFFGTHVCKVTFKYFPQPINGHIQSF